MQRMDLLRHCHTSMISAKNLPNDVTFLHNFYSGSAIGVGAVKEKIQFGRSQKMDLILCPAEDYQELQEDGFFGRRDRGTLFIMAFCVQV